MDLRKIDRKKLLIWGGIGVLVIVLLWWFGRGQPGDRQLNPPIETEPDQTPSAQFTQEQHAGEKSGYKIDIRLSEVPINPYPGAITTGTVRILNQEGKLANEVSGGVRLFVGDTFAPGAGSGGLNVLVGTTVVATQKRAATGITDLTGGIWKLREDGSNIYDFSPTIREVTQQDLRTTSNTVAACFYFGEEKENPKASYIMWERNLGDAYYVMLDRGQGEFSYISRGLENPVRITALAAEEPIYPPADPQYEFRWGYAVSFLPRELLTVQQLDGGVRFGAPPTYQLISDEPKEVRDARLANVLGYQVIGTPVHYRSAGIYTVATASVGEFKDFSKPKTINQRLKYVNGNFRTDLMDYYYEVTAEPKTLTGQPGGKFTLTIKPKAEPGKTLPRTIHDYIALDLKEGYSLTAPLVNTSRKDGWLKRNYLAYFTGVNGKLLDKDYFRSNYDPSSDIPSTGWIPKGLGGPAQIPLISAGDTITVELEQTGESSVLDMLTVRLTSRRAADAARAGVYGNGCVQGVDQIISVPTK